MNDKNPRRRWFQFRLRSVLLLMLGIALWLGHEVNWASRQQRHVAAIEELGGSVEYESYRWSLLRFYDPKKYGRAVANAKIPGTRVAGATPHLEGLSHLRQLIVVYDGTCDLQPHLDRLRAALRNVAVEPNGYTVLENNSYIDWGKTHLLSKRHTQAARHVIERLQTKMLATNFPVSWVERWTDPVVGFGFLDRVENGISLYVQFDVKIQTTMIPLSDDEATAEVILLTLSVWDGRDGSKVENKTVAAMLIGDRVIDAEQWECAWSSTPHFKDVNGDGKLDLVTDHRDAICTYGVRPQGFHLIRRQVRRWWEDSQGWKSRFEDVPVNSKKQIPPAR